MSSIYVVTIKEPLEKIAFSSMASIYHRFTPEKLNVSHAHVIRKMSTIGYFENEICSIEKIPLYRRTERIYKK